MSTISYSHDASTLSVYDPSPDDAEQYLKRFCTEMLPGFPFIRFQNSVSAQQLRQERPFLFYCITVVTSRSSPQRRALGNDIKRMVMDQAISEHGVNTTFLLGLLVLLSWLVVHDD